MARHPQTHRQRTRLAGEGRRCIWYPDRQRRTNIQIKYRTQAEKNQTESETQRGRETKMDRHRGKRERRHTDRQTERQTHTQMVPEEDRQRMNKGPQKM